MNGTPAHRTPSRLAHPQFDTDLPFLCEPPARLQSESRAPHRAKQRLRLSVAERHQRSTTCIRSALTRTCPPDQVSCLGCRVRHGPMLPFSRLSMCISSVTTFSRMRDSYSALTTSKLVIITLHANSQTHYRSHRSHLPRGGARELPRHP